MYIVEVDQSGKVEKTNRHTVLALSDGIRYTILVPAAAKQTAMQNLRDRGKSRQMATLLTFSACLFLLLRGHIDQLEQILIDVEYPSKDAIIRGSLLYHFHRHRIRVHKDQIVFRQVGRNSPAHELALAVYRGEQEPDREVRQEELLEVLGIP